MEMQHRRIAAKEKEGKKLKSRASRFSSNRATENNNGWKQRAAAATTTEEQIKCSASN